MDPLETALETRRSRPWPPPLQCRHRQPRVQEEAHRTRWAWRPRLRCRLPRRQARFTALRLRHWRAARVLAGHQLRRRPPCSAWHSAPGAREKPGPVPSSSPSPIPYRTSHQVLVMVPPEDEEDARATIRHATVVPWRRFPHAYNKAAGWLYRSPHVLDKMNVFGLPLRRAVWLDADVYVRRNVDELCELPPSVQLAATLNLGRTARPNLSPAPNPHPSPTTIPIPNPHPNPDQAAPRGPPSAGKGAAGTRAAASRAACATSTAPRRVRTGLAVPRRWLGPRQRCAPTRSTAA